MTKNKTKVEKYLLHKDQHGKLQFEMQNKTIAQYEFLVSYLKILLISASRFKIEQSPELQKNIDAGFARGEE